jgi:DNA polymerase-3 subunit gamma/tau
MSLQQSLYRKWRPQNFTDLKGQDIIRDTIFYALTHDQMSQAYLFCGPRGTGKTTTARLVAKLVNCTESEKTRPCGDCGACKTITEGTNLDILEVDAASNRGIDEIRQLRDSVRFMPTQAKYKVFIIDEVHMLTREAFNALLKTLEEPPAHALFILATTEAHKIPPTIASRCQRYDFRLATLDTLTSHLLLVAKQENMKLTPEAAQFVARLAEGSFRDALSLLEQVRTADYPEYSLEVVEKLFGFIPQEHMAAGVIAILQGNLTEAHAAVDEALGQGADIKAYCTQMLHLSQQGMEAIALGSLKDLPPHFAKACQEVGLNGMLAWVELLLEAMNQMKQSPIPRLPLDVAITKFSVGRLKTPVVNSATVPKPVITKQPPPDQPETKEVVTIAAAAPTPESAPIHETVTVPVAVTFADGVNQEDWHKTLQELKAHAPSLVTSLSHAKVSGLEGDVLRIAVRYKMHADKINQPVNRKKIESALETVLQAPLKIEALVVKDLPVDEDVVDVASVFEFEE